MSSTTFVELGSETPPMAQAKATAAWTAASLAMLSVRFIQGFIYWGGGTRRFIYAPSKLDAWGGHSWMANKFQTAMPGALLGTDKLVAFLLHHFWLLYPSVIIFSAVELFAGLFLMIGLFTRAAGALSIGLSFVLMLLFGWQGATCIDEWTMAAANFGIGITLFLAGSSTYAVDNILLRRSPALANRAWFRWTAGSLPLPVRDLSFKKLTLVLFWISVAFSVATYDHYRGSVVTPFHGGPVSPSVHHWGLSEGTIDTDGKITFRAYVDAGTPAEPSNVIEAKLFDSNGKIVEKWNSTALAQLPKAAIRNDFDYQRFHAGKFGIVGPVGAVATIELPASTGGVTLAGGHYALKLVSVNNHTWALPLSLGQ
jgi:thiosulfate dehydrogenase [quinone] large subunit